MNVKIAMLVAPSEDERFTLVVASSSLIERTVHQEIHCRLCFVARDKSLAEVAREIVVGGLGPRLDDAADRIDEGLLHAKTRKFGEDVLHLLRRDLIVLEPTPVDSDSGRGKRDLGLLVEGDRWCGVQRYGVPDELHATIVEALLARELPCDIGSFDFKTPVTTREVVREAEIVQERRDRNDFRILLDALPLAEPNREQPRSDRMVVEGRLGILFGVVQRARNDGRVRNLDPGEQSRPRAGSDQGFHKSISSYEMTRNLRRRTARPIGRWCRLIRRYQELH